MRGIGWLRCGVVVGMVMGLMGCGDAGEPHVENASTAAGPREIKSARLDAALEGLSFEGDRVVVDPSAPPPGEPARTLIEQGLQLRSQGRLLEALAAFAQAVRADPEDPEAHAHLGRSLRRKGRTEQALAAFRTAAELNPEEPELRYEAGKALRRLRRPEEAVESFQAALSLDPDHGPSHGQLAVVSYYAGRSDTALHHLDRARELGAPVSEVLRSLLVEGQPPAVRVTSAGGAMAPGVGPAIRIDAGESQAAETVVSASPDGELVASWIALVGEGGDARWRTDVAVSLDGGATWSTSRLRPPGAADEPFNFEGDPMTAFDPRTGDFWMGGISFFGIRTVYTAHKPAGATAFETPVLLREGLFSDKAWMTAGRLPARPDTTRLYVVDLHGVQLSDDLGNTWSDPRSLEVTIDVGHIPRLGPGGELYILYWDLEEGIFLIRSFDGGQTFVEPIRVATRMAFWDTLDDSRAPGRFRVPALPSLAVDPRDGTLYASWFDTTRRIGEESELDIYFSRSTDRGSTWDTPRALELDGDQLAPWIEVDAEGRVHLLYFDTRRHPGTDQDETALVDVVHAVSLDRGESWQETRLTDTPIDTARAGWFETAGTPQFLGDYINLATAGDRAWAVYPALGATDLDVFTRTLDLSTLPSAPLDDCRPGPEALCLVDGRFRVQVAWTDPRSGDTGLGQAAPFDFSDDSGTFWFFDQANVELVVKLLDAGPVNGRVWFFSGGLSDVEYTITITDTETGVTRAYRNAPGDVCGQADTAAFPSQPNLRSNASPGATGGECEPGPETLCLTPDRFRVEVDWRDPRSGDTGRGFAIPGTSDSGFFWFFDEENVELVVKLLDGRTVNGNFWVFFGALTDVEYTITVTDTVSGLERRYDNVAGNICGQADVTAF